MMNSRAVYCLLLTILVCSCKSEDTPAPYQAAPPIVVPPNKPENSIDGTQDKASISDETEKQPENKTVPEELTFFEKKQRAQDARDLAIEILGRVDADFTSDVSTRLRNMSRILRMSELMFATYEQNFRQCTFGVLAFTVKQIEDKIGICPILLEVEVEKIAQTLIHESAHLSGIWDECKATDIELSVMLKSGAEIQSENDYVQNCPLPLYNQIK